MCTAHFFGLGVRVFLGYGIPKGDKVSRGYGISPERGNHRYPTTSQWKKHGTRDTLSTVPRKDMDQGPGRDLAPEIP